MPHRKHERRQFRIGGAVQGVGFRPFVYRLATEHGLNGWIRNDAAGVVIEVEGVCANITRFENFLRVGKPRNAKIDHLESKNLGVQYDNSFKILKSHDDAALSLTISPDLAICSECLAEVDNPLDPRFRYPFINCTNCGPRFSIITGLPYDRPQTTMAEFAMCEECLAEYNDPLNRRFHAQPIACPKCGPHLELWGADGAVLSVRDDAMMQAAAAIREGKILAIKGIGGFHLIADATKGDVIQLLRRNKCRPHKPFAVMVSSLEEAKQFCDVSEDEAILLSSPAAPIVLLYKKGNTKISGFVAPGNPCLGVMLAYTPLHHLLLKELETPIIATSGNLHDEPICIDDSEALKRLSGIADLFLVHNRPIKHSADDSVVRIMARGEMILRRGRGYAPLSFAIEKKAETPVLSVGAHMKNTVALAVSDKLILSPHIGDLGTPQAYAGHEQAIKALCGLYEAHPEVIACDKHPDYHSSQMAQSYNRKFFSVQHHHAHALSCLLDNEIKPPALAVVWDGTGFGDDATIWGGEFLGITGNGYDRAFYFRPFPLPGGNIAAKYSSRSAFGMLYEVGLYRKLDFTNADEKILLQILEKKINCPLTSSVGRLFDGVAAITGLATESSFEGEAAMAIEFAAGESDEAYQFSIAGKLVDWEPMLNNILTDIDEGLDSSIIARKFHNTLTEIIVAVAKLSGQKQILLTGGCFQNKLLLENTVEKLKDLGFEVFWNHRIPPNDGGIAAGQIMAVLEKQIQG